MDIDHLLSDMNTCGVHMLGFLKAKWVDAEYPPFFGEIFSSNFLKEMIFPNAKPSSNTSYKLIVDNLDV